MQVNGIYTLDIADVKVLDKNSYVYAGLTWGEYWSQENVTAAGNVSGSDEKDSHNESDTGAFDCSNKSYQQIMAFIEEAISAWQTIYTTEGNAYQLSLLGRAVQNTVLTDGNSCNLDTGRQKDRYSRHLFR